MTQQLYIGLKQNGVNLDEDVHSWTRDDMIQKVATVMGVDCDSPHDPDESYILTVDNLTKMFAIHMRSRYSICCTILIKVYFATNHLLKLELCG